MDCMNPILFKKRIKPYVLNWELYLMILPPLIYIIVFKYYPMYGAQIAFRDFVLTKGIWGSDWVGFKHFLKFFDSYQFSRVMVNTIGINLYGLLAGFPVPIILALSLNYCLNSKFKKVVQMVTYAPHFISTVVMVGLILTFLAPRTGIVNILLSEIGMDQVDFIGKPNYFWSIYVFSGVWQGMGWSSIIYMAALSSVDKSHIEAAMIDGASKFQLVRYIDIPSILPTAIVLFILSTGHMMDIGFEKIFLMQNPLNARVSEVISTYVYNIGIASSMPRFSYAAAVGLFKSVVNLIIILSANKLSKKVSNSSLF